MSVELEERVDRLEEVVAEVWEAIGKLVSLQIASQEEVREFKEKVDRFIEGVEESKRDTQRFKEKVDRFIEGVEEFKAKVDRNIEEMNQKWGNLANKMGTLVEDIVAPGLPYAIKSTFGLEVEDIMERRRRRKKGDKSKRQEYDVIAVADGKVFVVEVKSSLSSSDIDEAQKLFDEFFTFFPEFKDKQLVRVVSSLNVDESVVNYATKHGILVLTMGGEYLRFENANRVKI